MLKIGHFPFANTASLRRVGISRSTPSTPPQCSPPRVLSTHPVYVRLTRRYVSIPGRAGLSSPQWPSLLAHPETRRITQTSGTVQYKFDGSPFPSIHSASTLLDHSTLINLSTPSTYHLSTCATHPPASSKSSTPKTQPGSQPGPSRWKTCSRTRKPARRARARRRSRPRARSRSRRARGLTASLDRRRRGVSAGRGLVVS